MILHKLICRIFFSVSIFLPVTVFGYEIQFTEFTHFNMYHSLPQTLDFAKNKNPQEAIVETCNQLESCTPKVQKTTHGNIITLFNASLIGNIIAIDDKPQKKITLLYLNSFKEIKSIPNPIISKDKTKNKFFLVNINNTTTTSKIFLAILDRSAEGSILSMRLISCEDNTVDKFHILDTYTDVKTWTNEYVIFLKDGGGEYTYLFKDMLSQQHENTNSLLKYGLPIGCLFTCIALMYYYTSFLIKKK